MNTIHVEASKNYDVLVGNDLLQNVDTYLLSVLKHTCKLAIISDSNVWALYGSTVTKKISGAGFDVIEFAFPAGESSKTADTYLKIINFLAENHISRSDAIIALGGGVTGDMTGFAAATFLRGIKFIQIPTSLLAMVDSSVGGKTAIDLATGKNLVGAFYQPELVICDLNMLNTLPEPVFIDGCAEVIKYGVLYDAELYNHLDTFGLHFDREYVISRCIALKRDVVCQDEFDTGARQKLNLGHTIGHGIEAQSNYSISHGQAVAIGMAIVSKAGAKLGYCDKNTARSIAEILKKFHLPTTTHYSSEQLYNTALSDKKRNGNTVNLIVPQKIGSCMIVATPTNQLESFIKEGL